MATLKENIAELRQKYFREPSTARIEIMHRQLLDFTDAAVAALQWVNETNETLPMIRLHARALLAKLDEEA